MRQIGGYFKLERGPYAPLHHSPCTQRSTRLNSFLTNSGRSALRLVAACGKASGVFGIEMIINHNNRLFFLDAGPCNGGNTLPEFISMIARKDIVAATIETAMGNGASVDVALDGVSGGYWGLGVLHTSKPCEFAGITYSPEAKQCLIRENIQKNPGDPVRPFERCNDLVGLNFFHFPTQAAMDAVMCNATTTMQVNLK